MSAPIGPRFGPRLTPSAPLPAAARELIADDAPNIDAESGIASNEADRLHLERMEHERQSRLRRWQETRERR